MQLLGDTGAYCVGLDQGENTAHSNDLNCCVFTTLSDKSTSILMRVPTEKGRTKRKLAQEELCPQRQLSSLTSKVIGRSSQHKLDQRQML